MKQDFKKNGVKRAFALLVIGIFLALPAIGQLPTAQQVASQMKVGWNLGNTLEAICGETAWGNPTATQTLINSVKAAGFNTVRIPCAWDCHTANGVIDAAWIARVKEVVDYCINDNLYVIINIHWDGGWLENNCTTAKQSSVNAKQQNYWTQIANYFKAYNEHLLFASANEPNVSNASEMSVLLSYHQTFVNAVRATGGNNSSRTLIIQGPGTDIVKTNDLMNTMPTDQIANRLMAEIHYYTPWNFCGMTADESWGNMFYYWGNGYHSTTDASRNATWGEESDVEYYFGLMKTKFVDNGIPVIIGEFGAIKRSNPSDLALHIASREYYNKYVVSSAISKGLIPIYWDNGASDFGLFNRSNGAIIDQGVVNAIMEGAGGSTTPVAVTGVSISPTTASISVDGTTQLTATVAPSNATNKTVSWSTSNSSVATVSPSGLVTGVAAGSATITVTTQDGGKTATCAVTVTATSGIVSGGTYELVARHSGKAAGIKGGSTANNAIAEQETYSGLASQKFILTDLGTGYYKISPTSNTSKALMVYKNSKTDGASVVQYTYGNTASKQWQIVDLGTGYYHIVNRNSGKCMDVNGASTADGATIVQYTCGTSTNQEWTLARITAKSPVTVSETVTNIEVYPNPVTENKVTISGLQGQVYIRVTDINGKIVQEGNVTVNETYIYKLNVIPGFYIMHLVTDNNNIEKKLIVR